MSRLTIHSAREIGPPLNTFTWKVDNLPTINGPNNRVLDIEKISNCLEKVTIPFASGQNVGISEGGSTTYFSSDNETIEGTTLSFYNDQSATILDYYHGWRSLVYNNNTGFWSVPSRYKKDIVVSVYKDNIIPLIRFTLVGCFPLSTGSWELTHEDGHITFDIQFSVDRVKYNVLSDKVESQTLTNTNI